ncbi:MAG: DNA internalization-related competence protein ComEC/Rec2 [Steroidobacteraceae bacterium]|nr:DNA internalization-related competence protein ComEC/Rec2 [Steroidobacteraceae bacterium]
MGRIGFGFALGACSIHTLGVLPAPAWIAALALGLALAAYVRSALLCAFVLGVAWAWSAAAWRLADDLPTSLEGRDVEVLGYIASLPEAAPGALQFTMAVVARPPKIPPRIRLTWYETQLAPWPGELWRMTVRLKRRNGFANPGGFDYEGRLFREGVGAAGYVRQSPAAQRVQRAGLRYPVTQARAWISQRIGQALGDHPMLGVVQGLAIGDTQAMSREQWRIFTATGTIHLMAISGLHIGMVAALAAWAGGRIVLRLGAQRRGWNALHGQAIAGSLAALMYAALAGLSIPTQRTLIMLCVYFAARWRRRETRVSDTLGAALAGVLVVDPFAPLAVGAWLSFGAVAIILLATRGRLQREGVVWAFSRVQLALSVGLTPVLLSAFGGVSLVSPLANALAVPLFTLFIVPCVLAGAAAACVSSVAGAAVLTAPAWVLNCVWPLFEWLAAQPFAVWRLPQPPGLLLAALLLGAGLIILPGLWPTRMAGGLLCAALASYRPVTPAPGDFELTVLDVGQGLAAVVRTASRVLVYDAGPAFRSGSDAGEMVVTPYLRHHGVRRIDVLMISHGDLDHRGGAQSILEAFPVETVLRGPSTLMQGAPCRGGRRWRWDGVEFEVLHPLEGAEGDNDSSCVLRIAGRAGVAVLTGDVERRAEAQLVAAGLAPADFVVAPHHGSRTSSTDEFVAALRPRVVVFSAGYRNRWNMPAEQVVQRWRAAGARTYVTAESGAVRIDVAANPQPEVSEYRKTEARYWRR